MTIIIETPAPPTRERLVLVPPGCPLPILARDATPADLARGGWVPAEETRADGAVVPVRRWENGIRAIASLFIGPRDEFEVSEIVARVKKSEHERAGLAEAANEAYDERDKERARAEKAERERDDLLARINDAEEAARALRAELARLTALDRATDDELVDLYRKIYETHGGGTISVSHDDCRRAGLLAVAAHVRKERCLVAQAVGMGADVSLREIGVDSGSWLIRVCAPSHKPAEATRVPTADVPATLARLLEEVARG